MHAVTNINAVRFADHSLVVKTSLRIVSVKEVMEVVSMSQQNHIMTNYLQCDFLLMIAPKYFTEGTMQCGFCKYAHIVSNKMQH
jgi:aerobic-type carbon monoxide dehydrogenase small subunit (CoxS/CutS family)